MKERSLNLYFDSLCILLTLNIASSRETLEVDRKKFPDIVKISIWKKWSYSLMKGQTTFSTGF